MVVPYTIQDVSGPSAISWLQMRWGTPLQLVVDTERSEHELHQQTAVEETTGPAAAETTLDPLETDPIAYYASIAGKRHSNLVKKRKHGFLTRIKTKNGKKILYRRLMKGRHALAM